MVLLKFTHRRVLWTRSDYVVMERIPFDVQHIALVTADLWIVRVDTAKLQEGSTGLDKHKINIYMDSWKHSHFYELSYICSYSLPISHLHKYSSIVIHTNIHCVALHNYSHTVSSRQNISHDVMNVWCHFSPLTSFWGPVGFVVQVMHECTLSGLLMKDSSSIGQAFSTMQRDSIVGALISEKSLLKKLCMLKS